MIELAKRIACPANMEVPVIRRVFTADRPTGGRIEITGLGWFALFINGRRVSEDIFTPALTDYEYRDRSGWTYPIYETCSHRIQYMEYDVASYLKDGENVLEIKLGPGFYRQYERVCEGQMSFGDKLNAMYALEINSAAGSTVLCSDGSEQCSSTEVIYSSLFIGEVHDANLTDCRTWQSVELMPLPDAKLVKQTCLPDRVIRTVQPAKIGEKDGAAVYDIGVNTTFRVRLTATGSKGDEVVLKVAEEIKNNNEIDPESTGVECITSTGIPQVQSDRFILSGERHTFHTEFVWHGGRYIEVRGKIDRLQVEIVHTAAEVTSSFDCADPVLSWLYRSYINSQLTNLHGCVPSDCPHRERLGYTGDGEVCCPTAMLTLDMKAAYKKWIYDILDCQDIVSGHVQHTAPHMGGGGGPGGWGCAMVIVPDEYDKFYGDTELLKECWPHMKAWISYLWSHSENALVTREEPRGWCLGDWAALYPLRIPVAYVNSCYLLDSLNRMVRIGEKLGYTHEAEAYRRYAARVKKAIIDTYRDAATGSFCGEANGADAYALWCGIDDDSRTLENLVARYSRRFDHFDTGFMGTEILVDVLFKTGNENIAYRLLSGRKPGSFGFMMEKGATTVWENFNGAYSHNHPMFGAPVRHLFDSVLGIRYADGALEIRPQLPADLPYASGSVKLPLGEVKVSWKQSGGRVSFDIEVPCEARFRFGSKAETLPGSGKYTFEI